MNLARAALPFTLLLALVAAAPGQEKPTPPRVLDIAAAEHAGKDATVVGKVVAVTKSRSGATYLNFGAPFPRQIFSALVLTRDEAKVGDVNQWEGKAVAVTGRISLSPDGKPQITVREPGQIVAMDAAAAAAMTPSGGTPPAAPPSAPELRKESAALATPAPNAASALPSAPSVKPSAPVRRIALAQNWDSPPQGGAMTRKDLATVFAGLGKTSSGAEGEAAILLYADIPYLAPLAEAKKRLKLEGTTGTRSKVSSPGLPADSFWCHTFSGVFEGGYNRLCLITDLADQLVSIQFVEDAPRQKSKEVTDTFGFHTYNFISGRTKGTDDLVIKHDVVEGPPGVVVVESVLVNPRTSDSAPSGKSSSRSTSGKARKPSVGEVMEMSRWLVPAPVVPLILRCAEGR